MNSCSFAGLARICPLGFVYNLSLAIIPNKVSLVPREIAISPGLKIPSPIKDDGLSPVPARIWQFGEKPYFYTKYGEIVPTTEWEGTGFPPN